MSKTDRCLEEGFYKSNHIKSEIRGSEIRGSEIRGSERGEGDNEDIERSRERLTWTGCNKTGKGGQREELKTIAGCDLKGN